jgi:terminase small subunit-like protein
MSNRSPAKLIVLRRGNGNASAPKRGATGRPSTYTEATAVEICRRMVEGESLRTICKSSGMPTFVTIFNWRRAHPEFLEQYARAREDQADALAEEMLDVARSALRAKSSEEAQGYRLLVDTLKWCASKCKLKPRSYGDKLTLNAEVSVRQMTDDHLNARLAYLLGHRPGAVQGDPLA